MKVKVSQTAKKRFRVTGSGRILRDQAGTSHLFRHKSARLGQLSKLSAADRQKIAKLIGQS